MHLVSVHSHSAASRLLSLRVEVVKTLLTLFIVRWEPDPKSLLGWWGFSDSNTGPTGYEPVALTN